MKKTLIAVLLLCVTMQASANENMLEKFSEYLDFVHESEGVIFTNQLQALGYNKFFIVDVRKENQYQEGHLEGAINIHWRQLLNRRNELPKDKTILLYCDTGVLSSRMQFILKMSGFENAKVLWGGYLYYKGRITEVEVNTEN